MSEDKPKTLYIASVDNLEDVILGDDETKAFYAVTFEDKGSEEIEDSEPPITFTMEFDGEIPEDAIKAIMEADPVIVKGGKFYDKNMNLLYDGEGIKIKE